MFLNNIQAQYIIISSLLIHFFINKFTFSSNLYNFAVVHIVAVVSLCSHRIISVNSMTGTNCRSCRSSCFAYNSKANNFVSSLCFCYSLLDCCIIGVKADYFGGIELYFSKTTPFNP